VSLIVRPNYYATRKHLVREWWEGRDVEPYGPKTALCGQLTYPDTGDWMWRKTVMANAPMCKRCEAIAAKEPPDE